MRPFATLLLLVILGLFAGAPAYAESGLGPFGIRAGFAVDGKD